MKLQEVHRALTRAFQAFGVDDETYRRECQLALKGLEDSSCDGHALVVSIRNTLVVCQKYREVAAEAFPYVLSATETLLRGDPPERARAAIQLELESFCQTPAPDVAVTSLKRVP